MEFERFVFYVFAAILVFAAGRVITVRNWLLDCVIDACASV